MSKKILLTGGAGYIGSHTYVALIEAGYDVVIYDNLKNSSEQTISGLQQITDQDVAFVQADILDEAALREAFSNNSFDAVIHFAALKAVGESMENPLAYFETNISGILTLLRVMKDHHVGKIVFSSSATVYGEAAVIPITESSALQYTNPYGYTKLAAEQILQQTATADEQFQYGILRYFNPAGAHSSGIIGEDPAGVPNNLMPYIGKVALGELPHLTVFGDDYDTHDGTGVRDYIHVEDLAEGHVKSLDKLFSEDKSHLVNIGSGKGYSVLDMLRAYEVSLGKKLDYQIVDRRPGDVATLVADPSLASTTLGFKTKRTLQEMCDSSWNWLKSKK